MTPTGALSSNIAPTARHGVRQISQSTLIPRGSSLWLPRRTERATTRPGHPAPEVSVMFDPFLRKTGENVLRLTNWRSQHHQTLLGKSGFPRQTTASGFSLLAAAVRMAAPTGSSSPIPNLGLALMDAGAHSVDCGAPFPTTAKSFSPSFNFDFTVKSSPTHAQAEEKGHERVALLSPSPC